MLGVMHFFFQMGMGAGGWFPNISRKMHLALMRPCLEYAIGGLCMAKANVKILENAQRKALCKAVSVSSNQTSCDELPWYKYEIRKAKSWNLHSKDNGRLTLYFRDHPTT
jgi:hypothetical protein